MEVLNPICMAPNKNDKKKKFFFEYSILHCLTKLDGVDKMFPFAKQGSEWGLKYEPKNN